MYTYRTLPVKDQAPEMATSHHMPCWEIAGACPTYPYLKELKGSSCSMLALYNLYGTHFMRCYIILLRLLELKWNTFLLGHMPRLKKDGANPWYNDWILGITWEMLFILFWCPIPDMPRLRKMTALTYDTQYYTKLILPEDEQLTCCPVLDHAWLVCWTSYPGWPGVPWTVSAE